MPETKCKLLLCDCEGSMALDVEALAASCGGETGALHTQLCRGQIASATKALATGDVVVIACGQETAAFDDVAAQIGADPDRLRCVDIRDRAGWSDEAADAAPKMAALLAEAGLAPPPAPTTTIASDGVCLIYGDGEIALAAAERLSGQLSVTCLLRDPGDAEPPRRNDFPILSGRVRAAAGRLGAFEIRVDGLAEHAPGGRGGLSFGPPRDGAQSECDVILDLSGDAALFPAPEKRDGYVRADPRDPIAVERALFDAAQLVGEFEKPLYIRFEASLCAHSRARQPGCDRCLNLCPTGAIQPAGDHVVIDPYICAGCGACAAVCPTGAARYEDPPFEHALRRVRTLAEAYRSAGGAAPRLLIHDVEHGAEMIALAARHGRGLPADVLPLALPETGGVSHALMLAALAAGFSTVFVLLGAKADRTALEGQAALARALAVGVGVETARLALIDPADPDAMSESLYAAPRPAPALPAPAAPLGDPRETVRVSLSALAADTPPEAPIPLDGVEVAGGAPYGAVEVDPNACTLCLSCVSLCPTGALGDNPDRPELRFQESACVQCGVCAAACPEDAIRLAPRLDLSTQALAFRTLHEEEPFACTSCGRLFGVKSAIDRVGEKLAGKNWMYTDSDNLRLLSMCDDCRIKAQFQAEGSPFQMGVVRTPRTTDDYLREREQGLDDDE